MYYSSQYAWRSSDTSFHTRHISDKIYMSRAIVLYTYEHMIYPWEMIGVESYLMVVAMVLALFLHFLLSLFPLFLCKLSHSISQNLASRLLPQDSYLIEARPNCLRNDSRYIWESVSAIFQKIALNGIEWLNYIRMSLAALQQELATRVGRKMYVVTRK